LFKNFLSLAGAEIAAKALTFAAFAYLARVARPEGFGYIEFAAAAVMCAGLIVEQGFNPFGAREIAKAPERTAALVSEIVLVRMLLAVGLYVALVVFALAVGRAAVQTRLLLVYGLSLLAMPLFLQWVFQGHDRMQTVAAIQLIRQLVFALVVFALIRDSSQIWMVGLAETFGATSAAIIGFWLYRRQLNGTLILRWQFSSQLLREGATIGLSQIFWVVKMSGATLILGLIASAEDVGYFGGAMRILMALHTFVWLYFFNLLPSMSRAWVAGDSSFVALIGRSMRWVLLAALTGAGFWIAVAPMVVRVVYGERFAAAGMALQWFAGVCAVAAISGHYRFGLIAAGYQTAEMATALVGAVAAMILIPIGYSMASVGGAAAGLFVAEILIAVSAWWLGTQRFQRAGVQRFQPAHSGEVIR
jgi:O-antigen/teichoic acid export membrane protein